MHKFIFKEKFSWKIPEFLMDGNKNVFCFKDGGKKRKKLNRLIHNSSALSNTNTHSGQAIFYVLLFHFI